MAEYLEKSAVIRAIHDEIYDSGKWNGGWYEHSEEQAEKNFTKRINAITPVTREHGKWIKKSQYGNDYCSKCDYEYGGYSKLNYCPNCGADMRGNEE